MALTPEQTNQLVSIYVGYFNRAPDPIGMQNYIDKLSATPPQTTIEQLANNFSNSPEAIALYPFFATKDVSTAATFIESVYQNLFNRAADAEGLAHYTKALTDGLRAPGEIILQIIKGTSGADDQKILANKIKVGLDFVKDAADTVGFTFDDAAKAASIAVLSGVDATDASVTAGEAATTAFLTGTSATGTTFALTANVDSGPAFTGTSNNDKFIADNTSAVTGSVSSPADVIDGAGGDKDLLQIFSNGATAALPQMANIELLEIFDHNGSVSTASVAGLTHATMIRGAGTKTLTVGTGVEVGFKDITIGSTPGINLGANFGASATSGTVSVNNVGVGTPATTEDLTIVGAALTDVTVKATGVKSNVNVLNAAGATKVTLDAAVDLAAAGGVNTTAIDASMVITGAGKASIGTMNAGFDSIDASANTGGVTVGLDAETNTQFKGSTANDTVTAGATYVAANTASIDAGDGTGDKLIVTGTQVGTSAAGAKFTNFETLELRDGVAVDLDNIAGITSVILDDAGAGVSATDLSAVQAGAVTVADTAGGAITIGVKGATTTGQIDTVKIAATTSEGTTPVANGIALGSVTLTGVENLEITGNSVATGATSAISKTESISLDTTNATTLGNITLTNGGANDTNAANNNSITIAAGQTATNLKVDASASTGDTTINAAAYNTLTGAALTGGSGNDVLLGSAKSDVIIGGAGNDTITADAPTVLTTAAVPATQTFTVANAEAGDVISFGGNTYTWTATAADTAGITTLLGNGYTNETATAVTTPLSATGIAVQVTGPANGGALTQNAGVPAATNNPGAADSVTLTLSGATFDAGEFVNITVNGGAVISANVGGQNLATATATVAAAIGGTLGLTVTATNIVAGTVTFSGPVGTDLAVLTSVETLATAAPTTPNDGTDDTELAVVAATPTVTTVTPDAGFNSGSMSFTVGTSVYTTAYNTSIAQTVTDFVAANGAAIGALTGGVVADAGGAFTITKADGTAFTGGAMSIAYPGDTDTDGVGADVVAAPAGDIVVTNAGTPATTVTDNGVVVSADANSSSAAGATNTQTASITAATAGTPAGTSGGVASDTITGGEGNDKFIFVAGASNAATLDVITDLNLGTNLASGAVDTLQFQTGVAGATVLDTLSTSELASITAAANLAAAQTAVLGFLGNEEMVQFDYAGKTYLAVDGTTNDFLVDITGVAGTLDVTDVTFVV